MPTVPAIEQLLCQTAQEVLETMFFIAVEGATEEAPGPEPRLWFQLHFKGSPPGTFQLGLPAAAANEIASAFLGADSEDDLGEHEAENVLLELTNVICGNALSRLESDSTFDLEAPAPIPDPGLVAESGTARCLVQMDLGTMELRLVLESSV
jgi:CheY-specific phosphatase CheX